MAAGSTDKDADVIVLGAGIVGVSIALHLQRLGRQTVLFDRRPAGEGTSFGNAGLIQREAVFPHAFPRDWRELLGYALNRKTEGYYHASMLPRLLRPFALYWYHSEPARYRAIARDYARLIAHCVDDHRALVAEAGAESLLRDGGWTMGCETPASLAENLKIAEESQRDYGVGFRALDGAALAAAEPHLRAGLAGGVQWTDPVAVLDPLALTRAYLALFEKLGGRFAYGDARTLTRGGAGWSVTGEGTKISAAEAVVALGAWSPVVTKPLGYDPPLFVKRGYHMHYRPEGNAVLNHPVFDVAGGYMLAPMNQGIRLTTGAEFADKDAPPTPVQLAKVEPLAHQLMPGLGQRIDPEAWVGARPCTPDMLPIIGPAPRQTGLWFGFGHGHQGLTLGPTTGRMLAAMMTGREPVTDPKAFRPDRF
ncbi:NAD(P)/FAD-dependent oxidoreductase [Acidisoma silvae]|uniref:FAD-binding oxidoreductase n=1 Tax=Acidisoma silvae TaxID=2802396 RepID=A0A964DZP8_9PROT|nr:FAD-binding oxidoreductase [Acidisoma silvae]MCB8876526.1 FAD-binding oxidoreductase [Acidisoma silvae]